MKKLISILMAMVMMLAVVGCAAPAAEVPAAEAPAAEAPAAKAPASEEADPLADLEPIKINLASTYASADSQVVAANKFKEIVEERSNGKITVEIFADGVMGGEADNLEMCSFGEIEMLVVGTLCITNYAPQYSFFDAPFIFENAEHMMNTWDGELGDEMRALMEENGLTMIGRMGRGYRYITSNELVESVEDMHKLTIRTSNSKPYVDTLGALGAVTVPLALTELFTSLQMGVVDASEGPMDQIVGYKLYEVQDHIALSGHAYSLSCWIMNSDFYQGLDPAYQEIIDAATAEACEFGTKLGEEREAALIEECKSYGVAFNEVDLLPFIEKARPAIDALFAADWPVTNADEVASYAN